MRESQYLKSIEARGENKGMLRARREDLLEVLEARLATPVPEPIRLALEATNDMGILERWFEASLVVSSWEDFKAVMQQG